MSTKLQYVKTKLENVFQGVPSAKSYIDAFMEKIDFVINSSIQTTDAEFNTKLVMTAHPSDGMILFRETLKALLDSDDLTFIDESLQADLKNINKRQKPSIQDEWSCIKALLEAHAKRTSESDLNMAVWFDFDRSDKQTVCYKPDSIPESEDHLDDHYGNDLLGYLRNINAELERLGKAPIKAQLRLSAEHINANLRMLENEGEIDTVIFANFNDETTLQDDGVDAMKRLMTENKTRYTPVKLKEIASVLQLNIDGERISIAVLINKIGDHLQQMQGHDLLFAMQQILPQKVMALLEDPQAIADAFKWCKEKECIKQTETEEQTDRTKQVKPKIDFAKLRHKMMHACSDMGSAGFAGTLMSFVMAELNLLEFKGTGNSALRHPSLPKTDMETLQGSKRYEQHFSRNLNDEEIKAYWNYLGEVFLGKAGITKVSDLNQQQLEILMDKLNEVATAHVDSHNFVLDKVGDISTLKKYVPALGSRPVQTESDAVDSAEVQDRGDVEPESELPAKDLSADKFIKGQRAISRVALAHFKGLWPAWMMPPNVNWSEAKQKQELSSFNSLMKAVSSETLAGVAERLCAIPEHFVYILIADSDPASKAVVALYALTQQHRDIIKAEIKERDIEIITPSKRSSTEFLFLANVFINRPPSDEDSFFDDLLENANTENQEFFNELKVMLSKEDQDNRLKLAIAVNLGANAAGGKSI
ncbi:MAG: hypothetical protein VW378_03270 [bacterium]